MNCSSLISPRWYMALYLPICSRVSRSGPASITPPVTTMAGMSMRPMAMSWAGTDLSQLERNTPASKVVALAWISMRLAMVSRLARE